MNLEAPPKGKLSQRVSDLNWYWTGYAVSWVVILIVSWLYFIESWSIVGVLIGWIPSMIIATVLSFIWPVLPILALLAAYYLWFE